MVNPQCSLMQGCAWPLGREEGKTETRRLQRAQEKPEIESPTCVSYDYDVSDDAMMSPSPDCRSALFLRLGKGC